VVAQSWSPPPPSKVRKVFEVDTLGLDLSVYLGLESGLRIDDLGVRVRCVWVVGRGWICQVARLAYGESEWRRLCGRLKRL
jgi:hypothetical protein